MGIFLAGIEVSLHFNDQQVEMKNQCPYARHLQYVAFGKAIFNKTFGFVKYSRRKQCFYMVFS